jgi:hypothetical protein
MKATARTVYGTMAMLTRVKNVRGSVHMDTGARLAILGRRLRRVERKIERDGRNVRMGRAVDSVMIRGPELTSGRE